MDIQSLYYFSELAKDLHMTRTAGRLFISQQTLSNHIQRLEDHYGVKLLHRKPRLSLTAAGEAVLEFAQHVIQEEDRLNRRLSDLGQESTGIIRFGASHLRMQACLPQILPKFSAQYPNVELRLTYTNSAQLEPLVLNGQLDYAVLLNQSEEINPKLHQIHLMNDQLYLCVTDQLLRRFCQNTDELCERAIRGANIVDFSDLPFCMYPNRIGTILHNCFDEAGIYPKIYLSDSNLTVSISACFQGLAACVLTTCCLVAHKSVIPSGLRCFPLLYRQKPILQPLYLVHRCDCYLPRYAVFFQTLLIEQFQNLQEREILNHET